MIQAHIKDEDTRYVQCSGMRFRERSFEVKLGTEVLVGNFVFSAKGAGASGCGNDHQDAPLLDLFDCHELRLIGSLSVDSQRGIAVAGVNSYEDSDLHTAPPPPLPDSEAELAADILAGVGGSGEGLGISNTTAEAGSAAAADAQAAQVCALTQRNPRAVFTCTCAHVRCSTTDVTLTNILFLVCLFVSISCYLLLLESSPWAAMFQWHRSSILRSTYDWQRRWMTGGSAAVLLGVAGGAQQEGGSSGGPPARTAAGGDSSNFETAQRSWVETSCLGLLWSWQQAACQAAIFVSLLGERPHLPTDFVAYLPDGSWLISG